MNKGIIVTVVVLLLVLIVIWFSGIFRTPGYITGNQDPKVAQVFNDVQLKVKAITNGDYTLCRQMSDEGQQSGCFTEVAKVKQDQTICENIDNSEFMKICIDKFNAYQDEVKNNEVINKARLSLDLSFCSQIQSSDRKEVCQAIVRNTIAIHTRYGENLPECEAENSQARRDSCYVQRAGSAQDYSLCIDVLQGSGRDTCYDSLGQVLSDPKVCRMATTKISQDNCLFNIALKNNNFTKEVCDQLNNHDLNPYEDRCLEKLR